MEEQDILLGYEIKTGEPVFIQPTHLIVTGLTNKSGKTTTIQALASRSERKVLIFATKPGERVFEHEHMVQPFYQEKSDWQYVEAILSATMKEKMRFERAWIIRATKGTKSLREVDFNCKKYASLAKVGSLENNVFSNLHAYFDIVLPQLESVQFAKAFPELEVGINVMDLTAMREETQALVIRACLEHISRNEVGIITIIPELWKFAPEGRGNPVKSMLEFLIRQGATRGNFVWMDSQDLAGVDKLPLKQVYTWILGLQTERNEVQHTLDQLPIPPRMRPTPDVIMRLRVGHFMLATPEEVKTVYVQPVWLGAEEAQAIAEARMKMEEAEQLYSIYTKTAGANLRGGDAVHDEVIVEKTVAGEQKQGPSQIDLEKKDLVIRVSHSKKVIHMDTESIQGQIVFLLSQGEDLTLTISQIISEAQEHGWVMAPDTLRKGIVPGMQRDGLLVNEAPEGHTGKYRLPKFVKFVIKKAEFVTA